MKLEIAQTKTYILTQLVALDSVTVYATNYRKGHGKIVIECYSEAWAHYWGGMGDLNLQEFFLACDNAYILGKLLKETEQTDFEKVHAAAKKNGYDICVTSEVELAMSSREMAECFGPNWYMDLPTCQTHEYHYVSRIVDAAKAAFREEIGRSQETDG